MLTVLDLFSGIGGFSLGLERTGGFRTIGFCESDERKREEIQRQWPGIPCFPDVATLSGNQISGKPNVICGGFPCQDVSVAGRRAGITGQQSGLWAHFARLICELRPRYAIVENTPGLLSNGMGRVLGDLADGGYDAEWDCIPAAAVGAPHLRARIWILAYPRGLRDKTNDAICAGWPEFVVRDRWPAEPSVPRVDDGVSGWVVNALGNAVVPQVVEVIGRAILAAEADMRSTP